MAILAALLLSLVLGYLLARSVARPLGALENVAADVAGGNLRRNIATTDGRDETASLARSVHQMVAALRGSVKRIQESARVIANFSAQLTANAGQTSSVISQTAATAAEIAVTMEQVAKHSQDVAALSAKASQKAEEGFRGVEEITGRMETIARASNNVAQVVDDLSRSLQRVDQIVGLITHIAGQTHLLALNAAIEAAHAGDKGRGFAAEVAKLAEQSFNAGKDIKQVVGDVQSESNRVVNAMARSGQEVGEGTLIIGRVGRSFAEILQLVDELAGQVQGLAAAARQVSAGVENVAAAAEEQTASMQEVASATGTLAGMAGELNLAVAHYQL